MAEAYLKKFGADQFEVESAGLKAGTLNRFAIEAMRIDGVDISNNSTNNVDDFYKEGRRYDFVITVCDEASAERCPIFPGPHKKLHWGFPDPSTMQGSDEEKLQQVIVVRNLIKEEVMKFVKSNK